MSIAIDFGTSNTVVARWNPVTQQAETLTLPGLSLQQSLNPPLIPSLVYVEDAAQGKIILGQQVRDRGLDLASQNRFFRSFKRGIGANIQGFLPELDGETVSFEMVGKWFLQEVISQLSASYPEVAESLVLTVPVDSFEVYRHWLGTVCEDLAVKEVRMLDEPTAAALGYGISDEEILLVIDFGGGTLDLSLVRLDQSFQQENIKPVGFLLKFANKSLAETSKQKVKTARVLAKAGQNLGGTDIDNWLVDYFVTTQNLPVNPLTIRLAEKLKIQLSSQTQASEVYFNDETFESYELALNREQFEGILKERGFFQQLDIAIESLFQQAQRQEIEITDISSVLLVGGTSQLPAVQTWVNNHFPASKIKCDRPFEAIAQGALQLTQGLEVKDYLYHSYGVRYWDRRNNRHSWHPIIKAGQPYPMSKPAELVLGASKENQPCIELIMGELGAETGGTEVYFDGDRLITRRVDGGVTTVKPLNDKEGARSIANLKPSGFPGSDRVKIFFQVDAQRFLRITVEDLLTNETLLENQSVAQLS
jgi:molecular chaperone DnaK (HSP70)